MAQPPLTAAEAMVSLPPDLQSARDAVARQAAEGWRARPDTTPWPFALPCEWSADPFADPNWRFQLNCWRPMDVHLGLFAHTGQPADYRRLVAIAFDWRDHEVVSDQKRILWNDMGSGIRAAKLAYLLTQPAFADLSADDQAALTALAREHLRRLRDPDFISTSNHALAQIHGAAALCQVGPDWPEAEGGKAYVAGLLKTSLANQFGTEGVHLEHSPGYHLFAIAAFQRLLDSGWHDDPELKRLLDAAQVAAPWLLMPDGKLPGLGDTDVKRQRLHTPRVKPHTVGRLYREAGYAVVRRNWTAGKRQAAMLLVTCGYHSNKHKHADDLSFELFESGRRLIVDTGKYTYSPGVWRDYGKSARAHNLIDMVAERDDNGLALTPPSGGGLSRCDKQTWGWIIEGRIDRPACGVSHRRRFLYRPRDWLVLLDEVEASDPREMTAWLHLNPEIETRRDGDGWRFDGGEVAYVCDRPLTLERVRGRLDPPQGWMATSYHRKVENDALGASWTASSARLATIIKVRADAEAPVVSLAEDGFDVRYGGETLALSQA